jgi:hypothetical protein
MTRRRRSARARLGGGRGGRVESPSTASASAGARVVTAGRAYSRPLLWTAIAIAAVEAGSRRRRLDAPRGGAPPPHRPARLRLLLTCEGRGWLAARMAFPCGEIEYWFCGLSAVACGARFFRLGLCSAWLH